MGCTMKKIPIIDGSKLTWVPVSIPVKDLMLFENTELMAIRIARARKNINFVKRCKAASLFR